MRIPGVGEKHFYRPRARVKNNFTLKYRHCSISVSSDADVEEECRANLPLIYGEVEDRAVADKLFAESLIPVESDDADPVIIKNMIDAGRRSGTGPMAAVAGAIAEALFRSVRTPFGTLIIENGGDIFASSREDLICGLYTGSSFDKFALKIRKNLLPCAISSSSSQIGHSLSFGKALLAVVISPSGAISDAFATALANSVQTAGDLEKAVDSCVCHKSVTGCAAIINDKIAFAGDIEFTELT
ncbi:MAG: hypothetical protein CVU78_05125 [Elusimicrobia bacterium HGW-Elusimicrobia-2]|nr:MAG: hypothetical protein CVU78_05125 [Elusimicrobia bacterium HGW-Elusimicrobia-2]